MTREEAKKAAEVMMAYAEGKGIEFRGRGSEIDEWYGYDIHSQPNFNWAKNDYRIKPEPNYRPFRSKEECWAEMQKHQPFGWIKQEETYRQTLTVSDDYICFAGLTLDYDGAFNEVQFVDGTPFGRKEE